jgi:hypothetical protein
MLGFKRTDPQKQCESEKKVIEEQKTKINNLQAEIETKTTEIKNLQETTDKLTSELRYLKEENKKIDTPPYLQDKILAIKQTISDMQTHIIDPVKNHNKDILENINNYDTELKKILEKSYTDPTGQSHDFKSGLDTNNAYYNTNKSNYHTPQPVVFVGPPFLDPQQYYFKWLPTKILEKKQSLEDNIKKLQEKYINLSKWDYIIREINPIMATSIFPIHNTGDHDLVDMLNTLLYNNNNPNNRPNLDVNLYSYNIYYVNTRKPKQYGTPKPVTRENIKSHLYIFVLETEFELNQMKTEYTKKLLENNKISDIHNRGGKPKYRNRITHNPHNQSSLLINTQQMKASPFCTRVTSKHNKIRKNAIKQTKYKRVR